MWSELLGWLLGAARARRTRGGSLPRRRARAGPPKIAVRDVGHRFRELVALHDVNIDVHAGEFVCLVGPSGCGKTTLLYALAGHLAPTGGRITIDGVEVKGPSPDRLLLFQEPALFPWLSVLQNLVFPQEARGRSRAEAVVRARSLLPLVHLEGFERALPHELSAGMAMRVQLARALALDPAVLLMDEPFAALDAQTRSAMHQLLQRVGIVGHRTVVFVTHDVREALVLGDRVIVMAARPGRVLRDLEVGQPHPRDPDDEELVELSRRIRGELRSAEGAHGRANEERGGARGVAPDLGARL